MERLGFNSENSVESDYKEAKTKVMSSLKEFFRPEFLNRLDDVIIFDVLSKEVIRQIVDIQIDIVRKRLASKNMKLTLSKEAVEYLAKEGYNPQYGARPLKRLIQDKILNPVAHFMIAKGLMTGGDINVIMKGGEILVESKKGKKNGK
jgi:ATP-dependent Clp protease ATP-binding subunit ClpA